VTAISMHIPKLPVILQGTTAPFNYISFYLQKYLAIGNIKINATWFIIVDFIFSCIAEI